MGRALTTGACLLQLSGIACSASCAQPPGAGGARSANPDAPAILKQAWDTYVSHFIQADGRVIDFKADQITTSEGQAYALLRAVWLRDRGTFDRVLTWSRNNLHAGVRTDSLWAWKWGRAGDGKWRVLDKAFASDADEDVALALIMASKTWDDAHYLADARGTLADLWEHGTVVVQGRRFLLGGDSLCEGAICRINPSYYAPYAYRIFAKNDPAHDWSQLVETTYFLLDANAQMTATKLPSDWILLDRGGPAPAPPVPPLRRSESGSAASLLDRGGAAPHPPVPPPQLRRSESGSAASLLDTATGPLRLGSQTESRYSYDAFRVHWRVALDGVLYGEPRARRYLDRSLAFLADRWRKDGRLPAVLSAEGTVEAAEEAPEMLAAVMTGFQGRADDVAEAMNRRVQGTFKAGVWADPDAYYLQNWAWFGTALFERQLSPFERVK